MNQVRRNRRTRKYHNPYGKAKIKVEKGDNMAGLTYLAVMIYFGSCGYIISTNSYFDLTLFGYLKIFCFFIGLAFLIPVRIYRKKYTMSIYEYIIINFIAIAPILSAGFLMSNQLFVSDISTECYEIVEKKNINGDIHFFLKDDVYADKPYLRTIKNRDKFVRYGTDNYCIEFKNGWFGLRTIESKSLR